MTWGCWASVCTGSCESGRKLWITGGVGDGGHCAVYNGSFLFRVECFGWEGFKSLPVCVPIFYGSEGFLVGVKSVTMSFCYVHNAFVLGRFQEMFSLSYNFPLWTLLDSVFLFLDLLFDFKLNLVWKRS